MKPLVYVAGPYRKPEPVINASRAIAAGRRIRDELDVVPIIPHLSLFEHFACPASDQYWLDATMEQLRRCDAMYRIAGFSSGSDAEEAEAVRLGIPVFKSLSSLAEWANQWKENHAG